MRLRCLLLPVLLWAAGVAAAEDPPSIEVHVDPQRLGVEDLTRLSIRVSDPGEQRPTADLGSLTNFEVVQGPSTETQFSWVNGRSSSAITLSWILKPLEVGPARVGPDITVRVGGRELSAGSVSAEVVPGSLQRARRQRRPSPFAAVDPFERVFGSQRRPARQAKVGLDQLISRSKLVEGQPVVATIVLDTTGGAVDGFEWTSPPEHPGWWVQRVKMPERIDGEVIERDGEAFNRFTIGRFVLMPLKPGEMTIPAASARIGFRGRSLFTPSTVVERSTGELKVTVSPRPAAPKGYSGAVGDLRYSASLEPSQISFGSSATLTITLNGRGNLPLVQAPAAWPSAQGCTTYPPEEDSTIEVGSDGVSGSREWRTTVLPQAPGELVFEPVELAVFDPEAGSYRFSTVGPFTLTVEPPPPTPVPTPAPGEATEELGEPAGETMARQVTGDGVTGEPPATWLLVGLALLVGVAGGGVTAWFVGRRSSALIPPRRRGEKPAERARRLQMALERWWMDLPEQKRNGDREAEVKSLRKALEGVRFAPGRADHSQTVEDLENRIRLLSR